jgi:hypothetical protein
MGGGHGSGEISELSSGTATSLACTRGIKPAILPRFMLSIALLGTIIVIIVLPRSLTL